MDRIEIKQIKVSELHPFEGSPFVTRDEAEQEQLRESIKAFGLFTPIIARIDDNGRLEVVSGQRRLEAAQEAGLSEVPVLVRNMSRNEAIIALVDTNIHREHILPSERAKAYQLKLDAVRLGGQDGHLHGMKARDIIAEDAPDSARQIQRYLRLNHLEKPLLDMVDEGRIGLTPAVQLSYLKPNEQIIVADEIGASDATPNLSQAMRLRKMSETTGLGTIRTRLVMAEAKANQKEYLRIPMQNIRKFFPKDFSEQQISDAIVKLLNAAIQKRTKSNPEL